MDNLLAMLDVCESGPAYIHLPQEKAAGAALRNRLQTVAPGDFLELEALANAYASASTQEGFVNGWAWAQATARECLDLRKLPEVTVDYGPDKCCGTCHWFVRHYRYTGAAPWYEPVGCGHCMARDAKKSLTRNPAWRECASWKEREA